MLTNIRPPPSNVFCHCPLLLSPHLHAFSPHHTLIQSCSLSLSPNFHAFSSHHLTTTYPCPNPGSPPLRTAIHPLLPSSPPLPPHSPAPSIASCDLTSPPPPRHPRGPAPLYMFTGGSRILNPSPVALITADSAHARLHQPHQPVYIMQLV